MLLCIRDNFEMTPAVEDTSLQPGAVAESFMNVLFQHGRLRCRQHIHWPGLLAPHLTELHTGGPILP